MVKVKLGNSDHLTIRHHSGLLQTQFKSPGVSIITPTNKPDYMVNILANYFRQTYEPKELIIVLNNNSMNLEESITLAAQYPSVRVYQLDESYTTGDCLNFAVGQSKFGYIGKMDDDDYYASAYLEKSMAVFGQVNADVVGKGCFYVYFQASQTLAIMNPDLENKYTFFGYGSALICKKQVFNKIEFPKVNLGEDNQFIKACIDSGISVYSADKFNYVYIRRHDAASHTWPVDDSFLLSNYPFTVLEQTNDFISYITHS